MAQAIDAILGALDRRVEDMVSACTRCGRCVEACPMPDAAGIDARRPEAIIGGVLDILRGGPATAPAAEWARVCSGSGLCIETCDEAVNPRFLLVMTRRALLGHALLEERRAAGRAQFRKMSRSVRVLSRLQLPPELLERLSPSSHPERHEPPELVFYTGCNLLKTPHIGLLCLDALDRLGVRYEVHGGPSSCCGILQLRGGDDANALRQATRTLQRFAQTDTAQVLSWCPTCHITFGETALPAQAADARPDFHMTMFPVYLAGRLDDLRPHLRTPVRKRVALHEHPGTPGVIESVVKLLEAVPGVEVVDLRQPRMGYTLNSLAAVPDVQRRLLARELAAAEAAGVTTLAGVYHSDHRELSSHHGQWPFEIVNYMEILGESMGISHRDVFKRLKTMRDVDAILADCVDLIRTYDLDLQEVRDVVASDLLGEQILPVDREEHTRWLRSG